MGYPIIDQIFSLARMSHPEQLTLTEDYRVESRSEFCHFLKWIIHVITCGCISLNPELDSQIEKISLVSQRALQSGLLTREQKHLLNRALNNLARMSEGNFGKKHLLIQALIPVNQIDRRVEIPNSWATGLGSDEREQTLEAFKLKPATQANISRNALKVSILGEVSPRERRILEIVKDYLEALHGVRTTLDSRISPLNSRHVRNGQYAVEPQLEDLQRSLPDQRTFSIGFTNRDLYPFSHDGPMNFIYGIGRPDLACGLFSTRRICTENFEQSLKRVMKLAAHEFAHMRGVAHCTKYVCNMQGVNCAEEMDAAPLTFCTQDMAKLCHLNGWSLEEGYGRQRRFFEQFSSRYGIHMDFSQEIAALNMVS